MSKEKNPDFCFLFYVGDWISGVQLLTRVHKGAYIDLLMAQFSNGHLALEDIQHILGDKDFEQLWPKLQSKFILDSDGLLYNKKLDTEKFKRQSFVDSRRKNLDGKKDHKGSHKVAHMDDQMEKEKEKEDVVTKVKEKKINYAENVFMTESEFTQILKKYFDGDTSLMYVAIEKLDAYKLSNGKTYKSDAGAIRSWVADKVKEKSKTGDKHAGIKEWLAEKEALNAQ